MSFTGIKIHNITERRNFSLECPHDVEGSASLTWYREKAGQREQIHPHDSTQNKILKIPQVQPDDFGLYYCNGKPAFYLNVTKEEGSDTGEKHKVTNQR